MLCVSIHATIELIFYLIQFQCFAKNPLNGRLLSFRVDFHAVSCDRHIKVTKILKIQRAIFVRSKHRWVKIYNDWHLQVSHTTWSKSDWRWIFVFRFFRVLFSIVPSDVSNKWMNENVRLFLILISSGCGVMNCNDTWMLFFVSFMSVTLAINIFEKKIWISHHFEAQPMPHQFAP